MDDEASITHLTEATREKLRQTVAKIERQRGSIFVCRNQGWKCKSEDQPTGKCGKSAFQKHGFQLSCSFHSFTWSPKAGAISRLRLFAGMSQINSDILHLGVVFRTDQDFDEMGISCARQIDRNTNIGDAARIQLIQTERELDISQKHCQPIDKPDFCKWPHLT